MRQTILIFLLVIAVVGVSAGTFWIGKNATKNQKAETVDCPAKGENHSVQIQNDQATPALTNAKLCDELTIINLDDKLRLMAFGVHDAHINYGGVSERPLKKGDSFSVTLNQAGSYIFHDHLQEEVGGQFSVH